MLEVPTPCGDYTVADLLAHVMGLAVAFRDAAAKAGTPAQDAEPGRATLDDDWRDQLPGRLLAARHLKTAPAGKGPASREGAAVILRASSYQSGAGSAIMAVPIPPKPILA